MNENEKSLNMYKQTSIKSIAIAFNFYLFNHLFVYDKR